MTDIKALREAASRATALAAEVERLKGALTEIRSIAEGAESYDGERLSPEEVFEGAVVDIAKLTRRITGEGEAS